VSLLPLFQKRLANHDIKRIVKCYKFKRVYHLENFLFSLPYFVNMKILSEKEAILLLNKYASSEKAFKIVLSHSQTVKKTALKIARKIPQADIEFVKSAALLHDIGRFKYPPGKNSIKHGISGAEILRKEGLPRYALLAERHLGFGITKQDIIKQKLALPLRDFVCKTVEEKIVSYADNLVFGSKVKTINDVIRRFRTEIGDYIVPRILKRHQEIQTLMKSTQGP